MSDDSIEHLRKQSSVTAQSTDDPITKSLLENILQCAETLERRARIIADQDVLIKQLQARLTD